MDKVTKQRIELLHPSVRCEVTNIIDECDRALTGRAKVRITQGTRTNEEQDGMYAQGRTKPGKIVTNAKGGQSIHNYGLAVDICLIVDGKAASWDTKADWDGDKVSDWLEVVEIFKKYGWDWGGNWKTFKDMPHFEKKGNDWKTLITKKKDKAGYVILLLVICLVLSSCGSRKVSVSKAEEKSEIETKQYTESKVEEKHSIKNNISEIGLIYTQNDVEDVEYNAKPIDPGQPMIKKETVDGNTKTTVWENAEVAEVSRKDRSKKKEELNLTDNSVIESNVSSVSKTGFKKIENKQNKLKEKVVDAKRNFHLWWFLLLIIPAGIYIYRKKIFSFDKT